MNGSDSGYGMLARMLLSFAALTLMVGAAVPFTVVIYNVENLHDADGVAVYDDYQPDLYRPTHVATKVENIAKVLQRFRGGDGPDIVLLQEIEIDQTPGTTVDDVDAFLRRWDGVPVREVLTAEPLAEEVAGVPAEVWILKALRDVGINDYEIAVGSDAPSPATAESRRAIKCVTLSKFPITKVHNHPVESARMILETQIDVNGAPLIVFNNHWKSGASNPEMATIRIQTASVLRERLDQILAVDPTADVIIGGDLNAQYNQQARYANMPRTGVDTIMEIGYSEPALQRGESDLYNLWFELEPAKRGSDVYRGEWGTLMHIVVSRGLYDSAGLQYQDNSFGVARLPGQNADAVGAPIRWSSGGPQGFGFSDHLPLYAHFRAFDAGAEGRWMSLERPSDTPPTGDVFGVDYSQVDLNTAVALDALPRDADLRDGTWSGRLFKVMGEAVGTRRPEVKVNGKVYGIYAPQREASQLLEAQAVRHRQLSFYGELGTYKGNWQFVVRDVSWVQ